MGCSIFWEAQEYSVKCQAACRDELVELAEIAGWEYEIMPELFTGAVIDLNRGPQDARLLERKLKLNGVVLFPFGRDEEDTRPRLSFVFDNTDLRDVKTRNRLVTLAPAAYWREWNPRIRDQFPILAKDVGQTIWGIRFDGTMRVRRTEMPGFISFLNVVRAACLPLLEIHSNDRQARKMISDASSSLRAPGVEAPALSEIAEGLGMLFSEARFEEWQLGLNTEEEIEREQARAARAAAPDRDSRGGDRRRFGGPGGPGGRGRGGREDRGRGPFF